MAACLNHYKRGNRIVFLAAAMTNPIILQTPASKEGKVPEDKTSEMQHYRGRIYNGGCSATEVSETRSQKLVALEGQ